MICQVVKKLIYIFSDGQNSHWLNVVSRNTEYDRKKKDYCNLKIFFADRTNSTDIIRTQYFSILSEKKTVGKRDTQTESTQSIHDDTETTWRGVKTIKSARLEYADHFFFQIHISYSLTY